MDSQSPNRSNLYSKKVLLVDRCQATREVRAAILRRHGIEVHTPENLARARFLWQPQVYDLILLTCADSFPEKHSSFMSTSKEKAPRSVSPFSSGRQSTSRVPGRVK